MFNNRYTLTSDTATSKETGNEGIVLMGWSLGLPEQAHELILSSSAKEIKKHKKFFLPYERNIPNDKLLADLRFSKSINLIPIYFEELPESENIKSIASITIELPINNNSEHRKATRELKKILLKLYSVKKKEVSLLLNELKYAIEDLNELKIEKTIDAKLYCLEFLTGLKEELHFALLIKNYD